MAPAAGRTLIIAMAAAPAAAVAGRRGHVDDDVGVEFVVGDVRR